MIKEFTGISLSEEQIVNELEKIQDLGWDISVEKMYNNRNIYRITIDELREIIIDNFSHGCEISAYNTGQQISFARANTYKQFIIGLNSVANSVNCDFNIQNEVKSIRTKPDEPLSNKTKFITLINGNKISKIFDPYFDSNSISTLHSMSKLGMLFDQNIQCITTKSLSSIDNSILNDFNTELSVNLEIKKCQTKEHRRFIVLDNGRVIIGGCSLNDIDKNEVFSEETNTAMVKIDNNFFEDEWNKV